MAKHKTFYYGILIFLIFDCVICMMPSGKGTQRPMTKDTKAEPKMETKSFGTVSANNSPTKSRQAKRESNKQILKEPADNKKSDSSQSLRGIDVHALHSSASSKFAKESKG
jgi:hypothetical protein